MILQGSQRGGARNLAQHLLKEENDHVEVHELRGFVSDNLHSALDEAYALSKGTRAKQYLFSLSLNPPPNEKVSTQTFEKAIAGVEDELKLKDQPRAVVFHVKDGRRHCHVVWSRIDTNEMKAIPLAFTKRRLMELSRGLFIEHGWKMPPGMINTKNRDPKNFSLAQWQQAKRIGKDPRAIKRDFQESWSISDNGASFAQVLKESGYVLARGDRRGFVALDHRCEVFAVSKWVGVKTKDVRNKCGDLKDLPSVQDAKDKIAEQMTARIQNFKADLNNKLDARLSIIEEKRCALSKQHERERQALETQQSQRNISDLKNRRANFRRGVFGFWDRLTGRHQRIQKQIERKIKIAEARDQKEKDALAFRQLDQQQTLIKRQSRLDRLKLFQEHKLARDISQFEEIKIQKRDVFGLHPRRLSQNYELER